MHTTRFDQQITFPVSEAVKKAAENAALMKGANISQICREALIRFLVIEGYYTPQVTTAPRGEEPTETQPTETEPTETETEPKP